MSILGRGSGLFSARVFTLVFSLAYSIAVYVNYPLFRYYPLDARFSLRDLPDKTLGPAMNWYGWIAIALIPAVLMAAIVPKRFGDRIPGMLLRFAPLIMLVAGWYRERTWFL